MVNIQGAAEAEPEWGRRGWRGTCERAAVATSSGDPAVRAWSPTTRGSGAERVPALARNTDNY